MATCDRRLCAFEPWAEILATGGGAAQREIVAPRAGGRLPMGCSSWLGTAPKSVRCGWSACERRRGSAAGGQQHQAQAEAGSPLPEESPRITPTAYWQELYQSKRLSRNPFGAVYVKMAPRHPTVNSASAVEVVLVV